MLKQITQSNNNGITMFLDTHLINTVTVFKVKMVINQYHSIYLSTMELPSDTSLPAFSPSNLVRLFLFYLQEC